jgi:ankyrin repeat protein
LLANEAEVQLTNASGSTALHLAVQNTGKGGSGSAEAKEAQREIIELLIKAGASVSDKDFSAKTVWESVQSEWVRKLLGELTGS